jgi:hypothetical protein
MTGFGGDSWRQEVDMVTTPEIPEEPEAGGWQFQAQVSSELFTLLRS